MSKCERSSTSKGSFQAQASFDSQQDSFDSQFRSFTIQWVRVKEVQHRKAHFKPRLDSIHEIPLIGDDPSIRRLMIFTICWCSKIHTYGDAWARIERENFSQPVSHSFTPASIRRMHRNWVYRSTFHMIWSHEEQHSLRYLENNVLSAAGEQLQQRHRAFVSNLPRQEIRCARSLRIAIHLTRLL